MLEDRLTARILGVTLIGFPCLMAGSTLYLTAPALRTQRLVVVLLVMVLPIMAGGVALLFKANKLPP